MTRPVRSFAATFRLLDHWPVLVLLISAAALRMVFFTGLVFSDDTAYASNAVSITCSGVSARPSIAVA